MEVSFGDDNVVTLEREGFIWRVWDGDAVVYDALSGDTHRVSSPAGLMLEIVRDRNTLRLAELFDAAASTGTGGIDRTRLLEAADALLALGLLRNRRLEDQRPLSR